MLPAPPDEDALYLVADLLDKQIVDVDGRKVVRINDLELARTAGKLRVVAADVGVGGLLRRIVLAFDRGDLAKLPFSDDVNAQSRLLMRRLWCSHGRALHQQRRHQNRNQHVHNTLPFAARKYITRMPA